MKIKINKRIEILWEREYFKSTIQNVKVGNFEISIPMKGSQYLPIHVGERVQVSYYDGDTIYSFESVVVSRTSSGIPLLTLQEPREAKKIQRRRYVRVPVNGYLKYLDVPKEYRLRKVDSKTESQMSTAITINISGGGVKFVSNDDLTGKTLLVKLDLDEFNVVAKGEIVRCIYDEVERVYDCGLNYVEIGENEREKLITHIFKLMRQQLRKA